MLTAIYSILHFLVDGVCAFAVYTGIAAKRVSNDGMLVYNLFAFALQFPIGAVLDICLFGKKRFWEVQKKTTGLTLIGVVTTFLGAVMLLSDIDHTIKGVSVAVVILGLGNALFHIGGGVGTIFEDRLKDGYGKRLGIFVAPGAIGLFLGGWFSDYLRAKEIMVTAAETAVVGVITVDILMFLFSVVLKKYSKKSVQELKPLNEGAGGKILLRDVAFIVIPCFLVVVLRSYIGMNSVFEWKTGTAASLAAVIFVAGGKVLGGVLAAANERKNEKKNRGYLLVSVISLSVSALAYLVSGNYYFGLVALLAFNMTMPITLYILCSEYANHAGTMFGLLTFALFLGYLPSWLRAEALLDTKLLGFAGSLISLVLLVLAFYGIGKKSKASREK